MQQRYLGPTATTIAAIGQGTSVIGAKEGRSASAVGEAIRLLRLGIDLGMTLIDTAEAYGEGSSEELVGEAIHGIRDQVVVATKFSPEHSAFADVIRAAEMSLRRLKTDYIDLYQTHWSNPAVRIEETLQALEKLVQDGKVRYVGLSNLSAKEVQYAYACLTTTCVASVQQEYNLVDRSIEEDLLPLCRAQQITLIAYSPLAQGKLAGRDGKSAQMAVIAQKYNMSVAQLALSWLLRDPCVVTIPQTSSERHLRSNAAALAYVVDPDDYEQISRLFTPEIHYIPPDCIEVVGEADEQIYTTLAEALENRFNFVPSPQELAEQMVDGDLLKPFKVRPVQAGAKAYQLIEGKRVRYWAWVIAHQGNAPIPALIE
ncbi:MAG: aldo/keto reductase [Candidatus Tectimicrobiota bacterium]